MMSNRLIDGVLLTQQKIINVSGGDVFHGVKVSDLGFDGFGEAYFSTIEFGAIKGWKRHRLMTLNLLVPIGEIKFVIYDDRPASTTNGLFQEVTLSPSNYCRLTIPPMLWMGFKGLADKTSLLLNVASIEHQPEEVDRVNIDKFNFHWE